ncbi:hypothetical protein CR513_27062, partial [Mucuna pruriens]
IQQNLLSVLKKTCSMLNQEICPSIVWESAKKLPCNVAAQSSRHVFHKLASSCHAFTAVYNPSTDSEKETLAQPLTRKIPNLPFDYKHKSSTKVGNGAVVAIDGNFVAARWKQLRRQKKILK